MSWQDRVKTAAYTSPGGVRTEFAFEAVQRDLNLRGTQYNFIDTIGTYIQGTGSSGRSFPFNVIISGDNYDIDADRFFESLREPGVGILEHPIYGTINVVPLGTVSQLENLVSGANQAVFQVTFWETISELFPSGITDLVSALLSSVAAFVTTITGIFSNIIDLSTQIELISIINVARNAIGVIGQSLSEIASFSESILDNFEDVLDGLNATLTSGIFASSSFVGQIAALMHGPARSNADWNTKLNGYQITIDDSILKGTFEKTLDARGINSFVTADLMATMALTGLVISTTTTEFTTRTEALEAAQTMLTLADQINTWREDNFTSLEIVDTGENYQKLQESVALSVGFLIDLSFGLAQENIIILDRPRSIIDLSAELYGEVDTRLDFLISTNNMTGDEITDGLQIGRQVKYYV